MDEPADRLNAVMGLAFEELNKLRKKNPRHELAQLVSNRLEMSDAFLLRFGGDGAREALAKDPIQKGMEIWTNCYRALKLANEE